MHEEFNWKSSDGLNLFGQYWKPEGDVKAVMCLVHGMGEHSSRYVHVASFFNDKGIAVVSYDHRGHGKSEGKRGHSPSYELILEGVTDLLKKASDLFPKLPQFLYGHSMGGNVVTNYMLRKKPELKGVIISGPYFRLAFDPPKIQVALAKMVRNILPGLGQPTGLDSSAISRDKEEVAKYDADHLVHGKITPAFFVDMHEAGEWALEHAVELKTPAYVLHGTGDQLTSHEAAKEFAEKAGPVATLKLWDGLYHECHNEPEKEQVLNGINKWVEKQLG